MNSKYAPADRSSHESLLIGLLYESTHKKLLVKPLLQGARLNRT